MPCADEGADESDGEWEEVGSSDDEEEGGGGGGDAGGLPGAVAKRLFGLEGEGAEAKAGLQHHVGRMRC